MTVKELIDLLKNYPENAIILHAEQNFTGDGSNKIDEENIFQVFYQKEKEPTNLGNPKGPGWIMTEFPNGAVLLK